MHSLGTKVALSLVVAFNIAFALKTCSNANSFPIRKRSSVSSVDSFANMLRIRNASLRLVCGLLRYSFKEV